MLFHIPGLRTSVLLIAILSLSSSLAIGADDYSSRPIMLMVGASPGGTTDTMARAIAPPLASSLGRPVLVENRPGAGGNLAADAVAGLEPRGRPIWFCNEHKPDFRKLQYEHAMSKRGGEEGISSPQAPPSGAVV